MPDIINFEPIGSISPGYALTAVEDLINASWTEGQSKSSEVSTKVTAATTGFLDSTGAPTVSTSAISTPSLTAPGVTIPSSASVADVLATFSTEHLKQADLLAEKLDDFWAKFFPNEGDAYISAESALKAAMESDTGGISEAMLEAILEDERSRVLDDASRASDAALATFAARRYPVPPGAAIGAVAMIQQKAQAEIAGGIRKLTALSVEMRKFNIEQLMALRQSAMGNAVEYLRSLISGSDISSRLVGVGYDAQSKLITSAADFYRAEISAADLVGRINQFNVTSSLDAATKNQAATMSIIDLKTKALLTEIQAIGQMATSLYNNLNVSVGASATG